MLSKRIGNTDLFVSSEVLEDLEIEGIGDPTLEYLVPETVDNFMRNPKYSELIDLHAKKYNLHGKALLWAHGSIQDGRWYYHDVNRRPLVQNWIKRNDGRYAILMVNCCNEGSIEISSNVSSVLVPNSIMSPLLREKGEVQVELHIPGRGYVDSYTIDHVLEELRSDYIRSAVPPA